MARPLFRTLLLALVFLLGFRPATAANIVIVNLDGSGEGFNDNTPALPQGGNTGTTRGAQRLNVFRAAANIWGALIQSPVTISVEATFDGLTCSSSGAVLGRAGTMSAIADFPGEVFPSTWYHVALANRLAGSDLTPGINDILAQFNSSIDQGCFGGARWYYGYDHQHGSDIDLLAVVTHELGHGLGFSTLTDLPSGSYFRGSPDVWARFILDTTAGKHWFQMTDAERRASAVRTGSVVWDGALVTAQAPQVLDRAPRVTVNAPPSLAGDRVFGQADFGPSVSSRQITADVVEVVPIDACSAITNGAQVNGKIALIDRGACSFASKATAAQAAGAVAVVITNNVAGPPPDMTGTAPGLTIPVVSISEADGDAIRAQVGTGVNMTIGFVANRLAGANSDGKLLLYAPNPLETGSSISHWDPTATPNLLMEPVINSDLSSSVDLTLPALFDIGWAGGGGGGGGGGGSAPPLVSMLDGYPNPFPKEGATQIALRFVLDREADVEVVILDIRGRRVKQVFQGSLAAGSHNEFSWDGTDQDGRVADSGLYFARTHSGKEGASWRMVVVR